MAVKRAKTSETTRTGASKAQAHKRPAATRGAVSKARSTVGGKAVGKAAGKAAGKAPSAKVAKAAPAKAVKAAPVKAAKAAPAKAARAKASGARPAMRSLLQTVTHALDEMKAVNVTVLDVHKLTDVADAMVIASGNSDRHVRSIADRVVEECKKAGFRPMGVEGEKDGEWVLVDLHDVIVHVMLPRVREFYRLESLWDVRAGTREGEAAAG